MSNRQMTSTDFKAHRQRLDWTQRDTAEALGVSVTQISALETGRSGVTETISRLFSLYRPGDRPEDLPARYQHDIGHDHGHIAGV